MTRKRICVVTGSRAEYGLLYWIIHDLREAAEVELQLVATGMHLSPEFGMTVRQIEADGFKVDKRVDMLLSSDTSGGVAKSVGLGVIGMSDALESLMPDVVLVLGDRFEILAAAQACLIHKIPLAHIAGGDVTEGAFDESIRHAITKMSHVHFVTNEDAAHRVRQMGEDPKRVHVVGSPGLDHLRRRPLLDRTELEGALGTSLGPRNLLVTFHPVTLSEDDGVGEFDELLRALSDTDPSTTIWFTRPNADTGGRRISNRLDQWAATQGDRVKVHTSLGQLRYLSLMAQADAVVGNSSSGLYEAPSLKVPTVNIGDRQGGRLSAASVIHCEPRHDAISAALRQALALDCSATTNPYGDGHTAPRVVQALIDLPASALLLRKPFHLV
ncbi:UDP-N-acetylglucosamine 2-epimerase [Piscinibacter terrae]|uniref:UDP-N-acetylglucosamine 2-epimerase (Hydrolyzing) n=1 Tax=Piscinibacter terrae TaxID=2496871 RepID=A0A3N7JRF9_9BURK|nr:UDP-N-acetylglucosamine 2-epimerase [Albitalea terrae]RQP21625.1 UDP-N-acetylglucosamine 2-epimerase (hydrolyzing) [Albitalea terrae]